MTSIHGVLGVNLHQPATGIIDLLAKEHRTLVSVHFFHIAGTPSLPANYIPPIAPATLREVYPVRELALVLIPRRHYGE